ncbi:hypothetical protein KBK19_15830 [Microvirga sp. STR05]|uniref:Zinc-ribbon domain-containing protein n=1 Tax=Hymenobacter duratus TaxID=2771356 RepID=A0ABR8JI36_9BACT|nr:hypothetical protein [Hymenobacter duratus]MBD2716512.1 hypothetical protein [Hymenobacter duratus]MBR7951427.1 hypothetical protein [Microvirga sp. STR05]
MLIYGYKTTHLVTKPAAGSCPVCATCGALQLSVFGRYAHIYWIPLVPLGKGGQSACSNCQQVVPAKQLSPQLKQELQELKSQVRAPWWHFAGLALLAVGLGLALIGRSNQHTENLSFIQQPRAGDVYRIRTKDGNYSLLKVQGVSGNTVRLLRNNYETSKVTSLEGLNKPIRFAREPMELTLLDLQIMVEKDEIMDIERP